MAVSGTAIVLLVGWAVLSIRGARGSASAAMRALGFAPCPDDVPYIKETVERLRGRSDARVDRAFKLNGRAGPIYWYEVQFASRSSSTEGPAGEEFLFPLARGIDQPLALYLLPEGLGQGLAKTILQKVAETAAGSPRGLAPVAVPADLESSVLSAMGPPGAAFYDLLDDRLLAHFRQGARLGFFAVRATGTACSMELLPAYGRRVLVSFDLAGAARFVEDLAERRS